MMNKLLAGLCRRSRRKRDRELAELVASRGGAMLDRCQRGAWPCRGRTQPFRQLPALQARGAAAAWRRQEAGTLSSH